MKKQSLLVSAIISIALIVMLASCYIPGFAPFLGVYSRSFTIGGIPAKATITFLADGTGNFTQKANIPGGNQSFNFSYKYDAKKITMTSNGNPKEFSYKMSNFNKSITLSENGESVTYSK